MSLDKFYTPREIAAFCISLVPDMESYDLIVEPSAGTGSFSSQIPACLAYDLEPAGENIIQQDWLTLSALPRNNHCLVIGNPPFGQRSSLAKQFVRQAQKLKVETIAFILPNTFSKLSNQSLSLFPKNWSLIVEQPLENTNFLRPDGSNYFVPCSFYVWTRRESTINLRQTKEPKNEDFIFLPRESPEADFSVNGNSGKIKEIGEITNPKGEHYIKALKRNKEELKQIFSSLDYTFLSSVNGGVAWIGQQDILKAYNHRQKDL